MNELMKPRYKVIGDYPGSPFKVGEVIYLDYNDNIPELNYIKQNDNDFPSIYYQHDFEKYPNLFSRIHWTQRDIKLLPKYVRYNYTKEIYKVATYRGNGIVITETGVALAPSWVEPATESEYTEFENRKS
jgi:hypothetical protein